MPFYCGFQRLKTSMLRPNEIRASNVLLSPMLGNIIAGLIFSVQQLGEPDEITRAYSRIMAVAKSLGISISPSDIDFKVE